MTLAVKDDEPPNPRDVRLLGPPAVVTQPDRLSRLIEDFRRLRHRSRIGTGEAHAITKTLDMWAPGDSDLNIT